MKGFILFGNSLRDAIKSLTRNIGLSFASFLCMALTLTMIAVVLIIVLNIQYVIFHLEKEIDITVYLEQNISSEEIISLEEQIKNMSNVDTVEFVSKETWKELVTDDSDFLNNTLNKIHGELSKISKDKKLTDVETKICTEISDLKDEFIKQIKSE